MNLLDILPPEGLKIVLVLFLSFLLGLEREEHKTEGEPYAFGGVRTFPLIGLIGYGTGLLSGGDFMSRSLGLVAVAGFLWLSYSHKLRRARLTGVPAGVTSEISGLLTYLIGALVFRGEFWIATTLTVSSLLMLELKQLLEGLAQRIPQRDVLSFSKFLLLSAVILPVVPDHEYTAYLINPYKTWLVVVAVSAVSYGSYVLQRLVREHGGVLLAAVLGGAYSSTVTTIAIARHSATDDQPRLYSGVTLMACGMMYLRLAVLLGIFNRELMQRLAPPFVALAVLALAGGWAWSRSAGTAIPANPAKPHAEPGNPLELGAAFLFAAMFLATLIVTHLVLAHFGSRSVYLLSALMGVSDVDPYIMGLTQSAAAATPLDLAAAGIVIAAASNNAVKGVYAFALSSRAARWQSLGLLLVLAAAGLLPLLFHG